MNDRDPQDLDLEPKPARRIRGAWRHAQKRPPKHTSRPAIEPYKTPTYFNPVGSDAAAELPGTFIPTPRKPAKPQYPCAGVPDQPTCHAMLDKGGMKKRCSPCSDLMHRYRMGQRGKAKTKERKGQDGGNTPV